MVKQKIVNFKNELLSFSKSEKLFFMSAMICGFLIGAEYAIIRPVSNSVFIHSYTSSFFPYAWVATVPLNLIIVSLYNRYLPKIGCFKMLLCITGIIGGGNLFCAFFLKDIEALPFLFYIWKEVYILLMLQQLWSLIHATIRKDRAKYLYGVLFAVGGLGGVLGSAVPGFFAVAAGSENLLLLTIPLYLVLIFFFRILLKNSHTLSIEEQMQKEEAKPTFKESLQLIGKSKNLFFILLIVVFMQTSCAIVDFQFNSVLEKMIPEKDVRTEYLGRILGFINFFTILLQVFGSYILVKIIGLKRSHFFIPAVLGLNALGFMFYPVFGMISYCFVSIKAIDFSIFNIIKEMLYLPLKVEEKFQAKAIIDVFAYRTSKAAASFMILFFQLFSSSGVLSYLSIGALALFALWCTIVSRMYTKDRLITHNETVT